MVETILRARLGLSISGSHQDLWRGRPRALGSVPPKWEGWVRRGATNVSIHYASIQNWIIHTIIVHKYSHSVTFINPQYINFTTIFPQYFSIKNGAAFEGDQKLSINRTSANLHGLSNDSVLCSAPLRAKVRPMEGKRMMTSRYGFTLKHKHLPEMAKWTGLEEEPSDVGLWQVTVQPSQCFPEVRLQKNIQRVTWIYGL